jgi:photosystem II stability/assembly factor-like uncharacterized protein
MKKLFVFIIPTLLVLTSCKKSNINKETVLPFENNNVKLELVNSSMPFNICGIYFLNAFNGIAITYYGNIYRTIDKGNNWTLQYTNQTSNQPFFQIFFTDSNVGYVIGGSNSCSGSNCTPPGYLILKTIDGGQNWTKVFLNTKGITSIAANSSGELFAILEGISKSTNGGSVWTEIDSSILAWDKILFSNNYGFCTGSLGKIYRSIDNGNTWTLTDTLKGNHIDDIKFFNNFGFCIANFGQTVYMTTDYGSTWIETYHSVSQSYVLNPLSDEDCIIFGSGRYSGGDFGTWNCAIRQTTNSGNNWTAFELNIDPIRYTSFYSATEGFAIAGTKLIKVTLK